MRLCPQFGPSEIALPKAVSEPQAQRASGIREIEPYDTRQNHDQRQRQDNGNPEESLALHLYTSLSHPAPHPGPLVAHSSLVHRAVGHRRALERLGLVELSLGHFGPTKVGLG